MPSQDCRLRPERSSAITVGTVLKRIAFCCVSRYRRTRSPSVHSSCSRPGSTSSACSVACAEHRSETVAGRPGWRYSETLAWPATASAGVWNARFLDLIDLLTVDLIELGHPSIRIETGGGQECQGGHLPLRLLQLWQQNPRYVPLGFAPRLHWQTARRDPLGEKATVCGEVASTRLCYPESRESDVSESRQTSSPTGFHRADLGKQAGKVWRTGGQLPESAHLCDGEDHGVQGKPRDHRLRTFPNQASATLTARQRGLEPYTKQATPFKLCRHSPRFAIERVSVTNLGWRFSLSRCQVPGPSPETGQQRIARSSCGNFTRSFHGNCHADFTEL